MRLDTSNHFTIHERINLLHLEDGGKISPYGSKLNTRNRRYSFSYFYKAKATSADLTSAYILCFMENKTPKQPHPPISKGRT